MTARGHEVEVVAVHPHYPQPRWGRRTTPYREGVPVLRRLPGRALEHALRCSTAVLHLARMPTKRPRVTITETPVVARRLELAATRFPDRASSRADLLLALTEIAEETLVKAEGEFDGRALARKRLLARSRATTPDIAHTMLAAREIDWRHEPGDG